MRRQLLASVGLVLSAGCFANGRPIKQLEAGDYMIGGALTAPGAGIDIDASGYARVAITDWLDTAGFVQFNVPLVGDGFGLGAGGEIRTHLSLGADWRLTLDAEALALWLDLPNSGDRSVHGRFDFTGYFVPENFGPLQFYFGPKAGWYSGVRTVLRADGRRSLGAVPGTNGLVFGGGSLGVENREPGILRSFGVVADLGLVFQLDNGELTLPLSYSVSFYGGF